MQNCLFQDLLEVIFYEFLEVCAFRTDSPWWKQRLLN